MSNHKAFREVERSLRASPGLLQHVSLPAFLERVDRDLPPLDAFIKLGDRTALRKGPDGKAYRSNYERGLFLYLLISLLRPRRVLEFGTGRGYGSLCMAWAMSDGDIDGEIVTVDFVPPDRPFAWVLHEGVGPGVQTLSRDVVWPEVAPSPWLQKIKQMTGDVGQVLPRLHPGAFDLCFIDAGHRGMLVARDFLACLHLRSPTGAILMDDYVMREGFGVREFVDRWIVPRCGATLVTTDRTLIDPHPGAPQDYGMIFLDDRAAAVCEGVMSGPRRTMVYAGAAWLETVSRLRRRLRRD